MQDYLHRLERQRGLPHGSYRLVFYEVSSQITGPFPAHGTATYSTADTFKDLDRDLRGLPDIPNAYDVYFWKDGDWFAAESCALPTRAEMPALQVRLVPKQHAPMNQAPEW
eukprot:CAMPEP_0202899674 /NCGR_PEP_ID=MMETSP1392-20130828/7849_1 /ASSEMBLY_ACC=CAM_ASM_000868 /TAXON_ID=225041 /ORGANISM="Chlamydomonas chlamydogama, Strain SAG 11-48b" /LENGTH=110 /DNA_ID=CAMNT_0049585923 /DNA_START=126 /DNA_END=455 /DNA_ORIENTATION=-